MEPLVSEPSATGTCPAATAAPEPPDEKALRYWIKNLDLLLKVTGTEDFPTMERIYRAMASGAIPEVVYGRIEPPLVHFHTALDAALAAAGA